MHPSFDLFPPIVNQMHINSNDTPDVTLMSLVLFFRWSAIAARLPGRTDNEIKNVWHTHLKKRLRKEHEAAVLDNVPSKRLVTMSHTNNEPHAKYESHGGPISSPHTQQSSSSVSLSSTTTEDNNGNDNNCIKEALENAISGLIDENFWSELVSSDDNNSAMSNDFLAVSSEFQSSLSSNVGPWDMNGGGVVDCFWYDLLNGAELADV